jgi:glutamate/tyrosine decarboxylase-like PLP-dependent enzyme
MIGMGHPVRAIPADREDRLDVTAMRAAIEADVDAGHRPICVVGTAGTVGTGAVDDLVAVADRDGVFHTRWGQDGREVGTDT